MLKGGVRYERDNMTSPSQFGADSYVGKHVPEAPRAGDDDVHGINYCRPLLGRPTPKSSLLIDWDDWVADALRVAEVVDRLAAGRKGKVIVDNHIPPA